MGPTMDYHTMVMDAAGPQFEPSNMEESLNPDYQKFYDMLAAADRDLWPGCTNHSQLSFIARMMHLKSEHHMSERNFDDVMQLISEILPQEHTVPKKFYGTKKLLRGMGLPLIKIDCCNNGCMIYWGEDSELLCCKICGHPQFEGASQGDGTQPKKKIAFKRMYYFPLADRLKRLYASTATANEMRWHGEHEMENGVMQHCSESIAWKHFNNTHPEFAAEVRNVRLCLCTDGFQPFSQYGAQYSSWPVIVTPLNLPPWLCMKEQHMFLTVLVPGPKSPKDKLDVYLQPLIEELLQLWEVGVQTYDISKKQNFQMRAALMWTVSDFPAFAILSGWSTAGRLACPYCMDNTDAITLPKSGKQTWFDSHRKFLSPDHPFRMNKTSFIKNRIVLNVAPDVRSGLQILNEIEDLGLLKVTEIDASEYNEICNCGWKRKSIFWDLPYWSSNLIRHNLDVMHVEKNVFDNIFNTVMDVQGKTKDTLKSRQELNDICRRPELAQDERSGKYPKACYTLDKKGRETLCKWVKELRFPDGYASNLARCVDLKKNKFHGMKSHDCHVFMQRLMPIAFKELLPPHVWKALTELSLFFKELTATTIRQEDMDRLNAEIPVILCKLERIFPPSLFDSMEHLPVHLAYEASVAGPVQYRWMYPFERYLRKLKNNVSNKAKVEGSISNAYLEEEATSFCSYYFEDHVHSRHRRVPRNDASCSQFGDYDGCLSIFKFPGRPMGKASKRYMTEEEYKAARSYVLLNCSEVASYIRVFTDSLKIQQPNIQDAEVDEKLENDFPEWFERYAHDPLNGVSDPYIQVLAKGPLRSVKSYCGYFVHGYKFHTLSYGSSKKTVNSGVCIKGSNLSVSESDYYGQLIDVVELEYIGLPIKRTVLFKCEWFDPSRLGTRIHHDYGIYNRLCALCQF